MNNRWSGLRRGRRHEAGAATVGAVALFLIVGAMLFRHSPAPYPSAAAKREDFRAVLVETGTVNASRLMLYSSTIMGAQAKIVELIPEGSSVKAGDLLVRFDAAVFEQNLTREQASLAQARAELTRAEEDFKIESLRAKGDLDAAVQQVGSAEATYRNQLEGRGKLEMQEAEAAFAEAMREVSRTKTTYDDMKSLLDQNFVTRAEVDRAEQSWRRAEDLRKLAEARRDTLMQYERPAATSHSQAELNAARDALTREGETLGARLSQRQSAVGAARGHVAEIEARMRILEGQIAQTSLRASGPGLVVYRDLYFGNDRRKPQVGDEVWSNQPIMALPDSSQLVVDTRVREFDLHSIAQSQKVVVTVDAYPDIRLPAAVSLVGALAQEDASRAGAKFFPVTVKLLAVDPRLRTGMTARVEIETAVIPLAVVIPIQAAFDDHGQRYAIVDLGNRTERRALTLAATNDRFAAVKAGVAAGERVLLDDPTRPAKP